MNDFENAIRRITAYLREVDGTALLVCLCDDPQLVDYAIEEVRVAAKPFGSFIEFSYSPRALSLFDSDEVSQNGNDRKILSVSGLENLGKDELSDAIRLLNLERNRLGRSGWAILFWIRSSLLRRIASEAADFFSWRSATITIPEPPDWNRQHSWLRRYLSALRADIRHQVASLPLTPLSRKADRPSLNRHFHDLAQDTEVSLEYVLSHSRVVLLGQPGIGKSTLLQQIALRFAIDFEAANPDVDRQRQVGKVPVYIRLGSFFRAERRPPTIEQCISQTFDALLQHRPDALLGSSLPEGLLVLLDGLDEVHDQEAAANEIGYFAKRHPNISVWITTRLVDARYRHDFQENWTMFSLQPLNALEVRTIVGEVLPERHAASFIQLLTRHPLLFVRSTNPLTLQMLMSLFLEDDDIPTNRFSFVGRIVALLLRKEEEKAHVGREFTHAMRNIQRLLPELAWTLQEQRTSGLTRYEMTATLSRQGGEWSSNWEEAEAFVRNAFGYTSVFLSRGIDAKGQELFGFANLEFQEYFAAVHLVRLWQKRGADVFSSLNTQYNWTEVACLAAASLGIQEASVFVGQFMRAIDSISDAIDPWLMAANCLVYGAIVEHEFQTRIVVNALEQLAEVQSKPNIGRPDVIQTVVQLGLSRWEIVSDVLWKFSANSSSHYQLAAQALKLYSDWAPALPDYERLAEVLYSRVRDPQIASAE
jgi:hypothetical protein